MTHRDTEVTIIMIHIMIQKSRYDIDTTGQNDAKTNKTHLFIKIN